MAKKNPSISTLEKRVNDLNTKCSKCGKSKELKFDYDLFLQKLRTVRHIQNVSVKGIADALGVDYDSAYQLVDGKRYPNFDEVIKLIEYFNVRQEYFFVKTGEM